MALTYNASVGFTYDLDGGFFDGPESIFIEPLGVGSVEGFGLAEFTLYIEAPPSIISAEVFGTSDFQVTSIITDPVPILSAESFGIPKLQYNLASVGIISKENFGVLRTVVQWGVSVPLTTSWPAVTPINTSWPKSAPVTTNWN